MLSAKFRPWHLLPFSAKYVRLRLAARPVLVTFEVTMRCNASCAFCDYWKTSPEMKAKELTSFVDAAKAFDPMIVTWSGGEPLLRKDLEELVGAVDRAIALQVDDAHHARRDALARARALALGRRRRPVLRLARLPRRAPRPGARHPGTQPRASSPTPSASAPRG
jgi:hypothetical protein